MMLEVVIYLVLEVMIDLCEVMVRKVVGVVEVIVEGVVDVVRLVLVGQWWCCVRCRW